MPSVITTGSWPKSLEEGVDTWGGMAYNERELECRKIFTEVSSDRAYEEYVHGQGFGLPQATAEGAPISYDSAHQLWIRRTRPIVRTLGYVISRQARDDNRYMELGEKLATAFGQSFRECEELSAAAIFNNAFDSNYTYGDGKELVATDHPATTNGTYQNEPTAAVDFDEVGVEELAILIWGATNDRGLDAYLKPDKLIVPKELAFEATRVYESDQQSGTANNDVNAAKRMGLFPGGVMPYHWLTDPDAFFMTTNLPNKKEGMIYINRTPFEQSNDGDFDTFNFRRRGYHRYKYDARNPLCVFGSPGA